ncbi:MAG: Gfo/Idh/MocA family oxidoreductase [Firmicutes bacterium]|nr:Gfo/Idh/MocA family oxidoreductase [Bacillota bacterium]
MIRLAMLGRSEGNGHPYSWSAIINGGYDEERMKRIPFPVIYDYLSRQPGENLGIEGAKVTHVWTENREDAEDIAATSLIEHIVDRPEDVIGEVDAVIIGEDVGSLHLGLARPFIERNIPIFIDKPLTDNEADLREFVRYFREGRPVLSSSGYRYAREIEEMDREAIGEIEFVDCMMNKSWEKYGIHALEGLWRISGGGVERVQNLGTERANVVHLRYADGRQAVVNVIYRSQLARYDVIGSKASRTIAIADSFYMFKKQLESFVEFVRDFLGGDFSYPYPPEETIEMVKVVIAGIKSREEGGRPVLLQEFCEA